MNLTLKQKLAIGLLAQSPLREIFYWTGGTLLSYHYLHHRKSIDLDFFSEKKFSLEEINHFTQELKKSCIGLGLLITRSQEAFLKFYKNLSRKLLLTKSREVQ